MLTEKELNAFVRDEVAWQRALTRAKENERTDTPSALLAVEAPRAIIRRGSCENASALHFLSTLRHLTVSEAADTVVARRPHKPWTACTRPDEPDAMRTDPLLQLLQRSLVHKGADKHPPVRARSRSCQRSEGPAPRSHAVDLLPLERLAFVEHAERGHLRRQEARRREAAHTSFMMVCFNTLAMEEYNARRRLFREAMNTKLSLLEQEEGSFVAVAGMDHGLHTRFCQLHRSEDASRNRLYSKEARDFDTLERLCHLVERRRLEEELLVYARREQRLIEQLAVMKP